MFDAYFTQDWTLFTDRDSSEWAVMQRAKNGMMYAARSLDKPWRGK